MSPPPLFWHFLAFLLLNYHIIYLSSITSFPSLNFLCSYKKFSVVFPSDVEFCSLLFLTLVVPPFLFLSLSKVMILSQTFRTGFLYAPFPLFLSFPAFFIFLSHRALVPVWCPRVAMLWTCRTVYRNGQCSLLSFFADDCQVFWRGTENWGMQSLSIVRTGMCQVHNISVFSAASCKGVTSWIPIWRKKY